MDLVTVVERQSYCRFWSLVKARCFLAKQWGLLVRSRTLRLLAWVSNAGGHGCWQYRILFLPILQPNQIRIAQMWLSCQHRSSPQIHRYLRPKAMRLKWQAAEVSWWRREMRVGEVRVRIWLATVFFLLARRSSMESPTDHP